jgi:hypothetical protein
MIGKDNVATPSKFPGDKHGSQEKARRPALSRQQKIQKGFIAGAYHRGAGGGFPGAAQMDDNAEKSVGHFIGPTGAMLTQADLPPCDGHTRWVARRKAEIVLAVNSGVLSINEASRRYAISPDELSGWQHAYGERGLLGLRANKRQAH